VRLSGAARGGPLLPTATRRPRAGGRGAPRPVSPYGASGATADRIGAAAAHVRTPGHSCAAAVEHPPRGVSKCVCRGGFAPRR